MKHIINTKTKQIIEDKGTLGSSFRKEPWRIATKEEVELFLLAKRKEEKIKELEEKKYSNIKYNNAVYKASKSARTKLNDKLHFAKAGEEIQWSNSDGVIKNYPQSELREVIQTIIKRDDEIFLFIDKITKAENQEDLNKIIEDINIKFK